MLDFMGISEQRLPEIKGCAESIGELSEKAAKELGLDKQTLVVTGALDQVASMIRFGRHGKKHGMRDYRHLLKCMLEHG